MHGEAVNVNVIDYVEAADHHLDLPDAQVEEEEEVVVTEPMSLTNIETMLRNARAFRELSPAEEKRWARMLEQCNVAVTPGNKLSVFSAMVTFLQVKTSERMTNNHSMQCWLLSANLSHMRLSCHTPIVK